MFGIVQKNQKFVKAIMITVTATFVVWGVGGYLSMSADDGYIAKVGSHKIYLRDIDNVISSNPEQQDKLQILYGLINRQLLIENLHNWHMQATTKQLQDQIAAIPAFQESSGAFSLPKYQAFLRERFISADAFQHNVAEQIVLDQFLHMAQYSYFSSTAFDKKLARLLSKERDVTSYTINLAQFYPQINVSESQITDYYQTHLKSFTLGARAQVEFIILNEASIAHNTVAPKKHDAEEMMRKELTKLGDLSYNNPHTLQVAAKALNLPIYNSESWVVQGTLTGAFANPKIQQAIFNPDVIVNHNNSEVVDIGDGSYAVYRVTSYESAMLQPIASVRAQIITAIKNKTAADMASSQGQAQVTQLNNNKLSLPFANPEKITLLGQSGNISPSSVEQIFATPLAKIPTYTGSIDADGAFTIYKISSETINPEFVAQNEAAVTQLNKNSALFNLGSYVGSLRTKYSVSYHIDRLNSKTGNNDAN